VLDVLGESEKEMTADDVYEALRKKGYAAESYYMVKRMLIHLAEEKKVTMRQSPPVYSMRT